MNGVLFQLVNRNYFNMDLPEQEEIYRIFYKLTYNIAISILKDHSLAEDIVQEVFIKTIYNLPNINNEQLLKKWIKTVTRNTTLNLIKKNQKIVYIGDIEDASYNRLSTNNLLSIERQVENTLLLNAIYEYLEEISLDYKDIIKMRYKEDKLIREISLEKNLTENAVKQKLYRARISIKEKMIE